MTLTIKKQLAPTRPSVNGYGYGNNKKYLTIHQTGNTGKGANAQMHANLQSRVYGASWHWQVDDKEAIQSFEHGYRCWHASDGRGDGNSNSIGIEGCINSDGNYVQSVKNMAELAAKILKDEGIPIENMRQHHDFDTKNRKNCPAQIRAGKDGINWNKFVQMVKDNMKGTVVREPAKTPDKRSKKFNVNDRVRLTSSAKKWKGSSDFTLDSFKSEYIVNWLNADGTVYIKPVGADWGGNVLESDIEHARNNDIDKDDIIKLRDKATHWVGGAAISSGMRTPEYSVRYRKGNILYIDSGQFRGEVYDWDAVKK